MADRWRSVAALLTLVGGGLAVLFSLPPAWYGYEPTDSYVFDPPLFTPLWVERELMPFLGFVAILGLLVGLSALVYRDWAADRVLRVGGTVAIVGGVTATVGLYVPDLLTPPGMTAGPIPAFAGFALLVWGGLLLVVGGLLLAYSYLSAGRTWLGGSLLGFVPAGLLIDYFLLGAIGDFGSSIPVAVLAAVMAWELALGKSLGDAADGL